MKKILLGFVLALALGGVFLLGRLAQDNQRLTEACAVYLFSDTEVQGKDGKPLRRADLLDLILEDAIKRSKQ